MKKITIILITLISFGCETIEGPYLSDDNFTNPNTNTKKKILIEDFTGHTCQNCPEAAKELEAIHDVYGDQIIGIAIHVVRSFARPYPESAAPKFQYDFRTQWGDAWESLFEITSLPKGMVNRIGYPDDNHRLGKDEWLSQVQNELNKTPKIKIDISSVNSSLTNGTINIETTILEDFTGEYKLIICLTEDNIINWQKDGANEIEDYQHNHVLRTVLHDDIFGNSNEFTANTTLTKNIDYNLEELEQYNINYSQNIALDGNGNAGGWEADNMSIIAYIYNSTTYEILQVEQANLIP